MKMDKRCGNNTVLAEEKLEWRKQFSVVCGRL